ncbi:thiamine phosphate synthase [Peptostreptococcus porci]|uniref:thiamine phosphate synthase n=1 Tax=Peptostreptococcus porci TaxID=2652282 RepID=UPI0023F2E67B|nr:thiamine phosphate synthase [Peptostreptococcus porci]MDD7182138.1 thiamine phosphate synthase [Peptostreptococcus porci]MDY5965241.1 thiamine phosphate synthase [Peptostreptococcus porci]MDY6232878.1 thiamine phosphate synthase [Peptostreptococcus porci]
MIKEIFNNTTNNKSDEKLKFNYEIICVTNRKLCGNDFLTQIEKIASKNPSAIILREKDLTKEEYKMLAIDVMKICKKNEVRCILHSFVDIAIEINSNAIHLPLHILKKLSIEGKDKFSIIGASCHSVEEALEAQKLGCTYIIAGHIFDTDCKKGLPGKGLKFLSEICDTIDIPVYAIGGITHENTNQILKTGADGVCMMSEFMKNLP